MRINLGLVLVLLLTAATDATAYMAAEEGCGAGACADCHTLSMDEARDVFKGLQGEVVSVEDSDVSGLWLVGMKMQGKTIPVYLDYSKSHLITGNIIRIKDRKNLTEERFRKLNPVDLSLISTDDALLLGNPKAAKKIIVFTDPHCPYCSKLHEVLEQAVAQRPDLLFQIKLMPIKASSKEVSKTIVCNKSLKQLKMAYAREDVPVVDCETDVIEQTLAIAESLGIRSTPTLILPNGQVSPGYKQLDALLELIDQSMVKPVN